MEQLIETKRKGQKVTPISQPKSAPGLGLMQALQQSLKQQGAGKSVASRTKAPEATVKKTVQKKHSKVA